MKESLIEQCLEILKREDIKREFKKLLKPVIEFILYEINPYIYITVFMILIIFLLNLAILVILIFIVRDKNKYI